MSNTINDPTNVMASKVNYKKTTLKRCSTISILSWNIENQRSHEGNNFLDKEFTKNFSGVDIICLQETKGHVKYPNYKAYNSSRPDSISGGVSILLKNELSRGISRFHSKVTPDAVIAKLDRNFFFHQI